MPKRGLELGEWGSISVGPYLRDSRGKLVSTTDERNPKTRWRARTRVRDLDGIRRDVEVWENTKKAALAALQQVLKERVTPTSEAISSRSSIQSLADAWLTEVRRKVESDKLSPSTLEAYERAVNRYVLPAMRGLKVLELTDALITGALEHVVDTVGPDAAKHARSALSSMVDVAIRQGAIRTNPMPRRVTWQSKPKSPESLSLQQEKDLLAALDEDANARDLGLALMVRLMLGTGCRIGEACAVRWSRIDFQEGALTIDATMVRVKGEGLRLQERTKTSAGYRTVALPKWLIRELLDHQRFTGGMGDEVVLRSPRGQWRDPRNSQQSLRRLLNSAGLEAFSSHALRKTAGTKLHRAGVADIDIADQLGHRDVSTTRRYYLGRSKVASRGNADHL